MSRREREHREYAAASYATAGDFCRIFRDRMEQLYVLGLLLTADEAKAEQCFVAAVTDAVETNGVFRQWAASWSRRAIIKNALRIVSPAVFRDDASRGSRANTRTVADGAIDAVMRLDRLERFVFVMSVLERYGDAECAALLGCPREDVMQARGRAFRQLAAERPLHDSAEPVPIAGHLAQVAV